MDQSSFRNPTMVWRASSKQAPNNSNAPGNTNNTTSSGDLNKQPGFSGSYHRKPFDKNGSSNSTYVNKGSDNIAPTANKPAWQSSRKESNEPINRGGSKDESSSGWQRGIGSKDYSTNKKAPDTSTTDSSTTKKASEDVWSRGVKSIKPDAT